MTHLTINTPHDLIYREVITALRAEIENQYGSIKQYSEKSKHGFDRFNLSRVFNWHQDISLTTYLQVIAELNLLGREIQPLPAGVGSTLSLRDYLSIDTHAVTQSIMILGMEATALVRRPNAKAVAIVEGAK